MAGQQGQPKYGFGWPDGRLGGLGPPGSTTPVPVAVADISSCPPLYSFQFADVVLSEWVPDSRSTFQFRPQDGFVGHVLD